MPPVTISAPGIPNKHKAFRPPLKNDLTLPPPKEGHFPAFFVDLLGAVISEQQQTHTGKTRLQLKEGRKAPISCNECLTYAFTFDTRSEPPDGSEAQLEIGDRSIEAVVSGFKNPLIFVAVKEDLGDLVENATLYMDNTALLQKLKKQYEAIVADANGFNSHLADLALGRGKARFSIRENVTTSGFARLNTRQKEAVSHGLDSERLFLWGPPGTGKSATLSVLIRQMYAEGKRIFITSNTNFAVDGVLKSVVKTLREEGDRGLAEGQIVRLGKIFDQALEADFQEQIVPDFIVEAKSKALQQERVQVEKALLKDQRRIRELNESLSWFKEERRLIAEQNKAEREQEASAMQLRKQQQAVDIALQAMEKTTAKLAQWDDASIIRRLLLGKRERLEHMARQQQDRIDKERSTLRVKEREVKRKTAKAHRTVGLLREHEPSRPDVSEQQAKKALGTHQAKAEEATKKIAEIDKALAAIRSEVLSSSRILAATVHQAYLKEDIFKDFDVVVIDEASMIPIPMLYYCCGLAGKQIVIGGDFRQLPPIANTKQKALFEWLAKDVFEIAGVVRAVEQSESPDGLVMLEEQYRMDDAICQCISGVFYGGKLRTGKERQPSAGFAMPSFFDERLVIVDTSSLSPCCQRNANGSKYNMIHAATVRELCIRLQDEGCLPDKGALGVCTPFAAQSDFVKTMLAEDQFGDLVTVGSVHTYQGDEKNVMIIDFPECPPEKQAGMWSGHDRLSDDGAKLYNVAVSRAKECLVLLANLQFMEEKLPSNSLLRGILHDAQTRGQTLDALDLLGADVFAATEAAVGGSSMQWYSERTFRQAAREDIANARKSIVLFSGFVTSRRASDWIDLLRDKALQGVALRCITRSPQDMQNPQDALEGIKALERAGAQIDLRTNAHQKALLIDGETMWLGSLNPLSYTEQTREIMMRTVNATACQELARFSCLTPPSPKEKNPLAVLLAATPKRCSKCGGLTYQKSSNPRAARPCVECTKPKAPPKRQGRRASAASDTPQCPKCEKPMVKRKGSKGAFWGCPRFPKCTGSRSL